MDHNFPPSCQLRILKCVAGSLAPHPKGAIASGSPALSAVPREVRPGQALPSWPCRWPSGDDTYGLWWSQASQTLDQKLWMGFSTKNTTLIVKLTEPMDHVMKGCNYVLPTTYVVPKSLKVGHWLSEKGSAPSSGTVPCAKSFEGGFWKNLLLNSDY